MTRGREPDRGGTYDGSMSVRVTVNGSPIDLAKASTVADLLERLETRGPCAVEVNRRVIPRREHAEHRLEPGDVVEVVTLVGGG